VVVVWIGRLDETFALGRGAVTLVAGREKPNDFKPGLLLVDVTLRAGYDFGLDTDLLMLDMLLRDEDETRLAASASTAIIPTIKKARTPAIIFFNFVSS
jgi:hypothetical protein